MNVLRLTKKIQFNVNIAGNGDPGNFVNSENVGYHSVTVPGSTILSASYLIYDDASGIAPAVSIQAFVGDVGPHGTTGPAPSGPTASVTVNAGNAPSGVINVELIVVYIPVDMGK